MHSFLIVAIGMAGFALFASLNMGTWGKLAEDKAETRATAMLIEYACRLEGACPDGVSPNNSKYGGFPSDKHKCVYTKDEYAKNSSFLSLLAGKTRKSYYCVGQVENRKFVKHRDASTRGCDPEPEIPPSLTLTEGAVVLCKKN